MASYIFEFKWPDYKFLDGSETIANNEEQALRNIIFRNERLRKNRTKGELALLADRMIAQDAFIAYDTTEYRSMKACVAAIREALGANQTVQEIGGDVGLPVDRELAIPYNQGKAKPDGDDRHNHFYKDVNEVQDPFQF